MNRLSKGCSLYCRWDGCPRSEETTQGSISSHQLSVVHIKGGQQRFNFPHESYTLGGNFHLHRSLQLCEDLPRPSGSSLTLLNGSCLKHSCELGNFAYGLHVEQCYWIHAEFLMCTNGATLVEKEGPYSWLSGIYSQFPGGWIKRKCLYVKGDGEGVAVVNSWWIKRRERLVVLCTYYFKILPVWKFSW